MLQEEACKALGKAHHNFDDKPAAATAQALVAIAYILQEIVVLLDSRLAVPGVRTVNLEQQQEEGMPRHAWLAYVKNTNDRLDHFRTELDTLAAVIGMRRSENH